MRAEGEGACLFKWLGLKCRWDSTHQQTIKRRIFKGVPILLKCVSFSPFRTTKSGVLLLSSRCRTKVVTCWQQTVKWKWKSGSQFWTRFSSSTLKLWCRKSGTETLMKVGRCGSLQVCKRSTVSSVSPEDAGSRQIIDRYMEVGHLWAPYRWMSYSRDPYSRMSYDDIICVRKSCNGKNHSFGGRKEDLSSSPSNTIHQPWDLRQAPYIFRELKYKYRYVGLLTCKVGNKNGICWLVGRLSKIMYLKCLAESQHLKC